MTFTPTERYERAIAAIDAANADDPNTLVVRGVERPKEQAHAELMTEWVLRLDPDATEDQLLAARAHHLRRWSIPRDSYTEGRAGYLKWRLALKKQHAEEVAGILAEQGYDPETVERVQRIIRKDGLQHDPAVQTHEDALCIVFVETQLAELTEQLGDDKTVDVIAKTLKKMSPAGISAAAEVVPDDHSRELLLRAVGGGSEA